MKNYVRCFLSMGMVLCLSTYSITAQSPQAIPYQAVARDSSGNFLANQSIALRFTIRDSIMTGPIVYRETQSCTTNGLGLFSLNIGTGTVVSGTFSTINWGGNAKFMQTELDPVGGTAFTDMGTQQMMSVPYALYALTAGTAGSTGTGGTSGSGTAGGNPIHFIGESYGGGIVFYTYNNGQSGLIAATADQSTGIRWYGGSNTNTCARANGIGGGLKNTAIVIANQGPVDGNTFAARLCNEYSVTANGVTYGDWYLPSKHELHLLYLQKNVVGGFSTNSYWSSTESDNTRAWFETFFSGFQGDQFKSNIANVRAIRAFYGNEVAYLPILTTTAASSISFTTAASGGNITSDGGAAITARGVCWNTSPGPTTASSKTTDGTGAGAFTSSLSGLTGATTYYARAYATNSIGTSYGSEITFTTPTPTLATLTTTAASAITGTSATSGGNITSDGGGAVIVRGVCWSTTPDPTIALSTKTTDGTGTGSFSSSITGLTTGTTYYVRAYAVNSIGTAYGTQITFTTPLLATLSTTPATAITSNAATSGGNITNDGGAAIIARGVCWNTSPNPTTANSKTTDGTGTGTFPSSLTGLAGNTTYYAKAYATNSAGTAYGNEISFTTLPQTLATLTTTAASAITGTAATSGGTITSDGGASVTVRGVCWSTSPNPTTALSTKTTDGSGPGSYSGSITALSPSTTYYVKAYATNGVGTGYGNEITFTTNSGIVSITTAATCASGISGGTISSDGGDPVTVRGVCWGTSPNPTTAGNKTMDGSGTGSFTSNITGMTANTTYYVRAYATNSVATYYGNQVSFTSASTTYSIGQSFGGGIIFYIDCTGLHGLIAATADQSTGVRWDNGSAVVTGATASAVGTGQANTTTIVSVQGFGTYAASICDNLSLNGFTDWFLPSRDELHLVWQNNAAIGGFSFANYWSSTENDSFFAWKESFFSNGGGAQTSFSKTNSTPRVRAVRAF